LKYSLHPKELSGWKGRIAERLARLYIKDVLIPKLEKEFNIVFLEFTSSGPFSDFLPLSFVDCALLRKEKIDWAKAWKEADVRLFDESGKEIPLVGRRYKLEMERWKNEHIDNVKKRGIPRRIKGIFLKRGVFPSLDMYGKTINLISLLEVATDGILFKLNKTGEVIDRKKALSGMKGNTNILLNELPEKIPIVSGDIEVIEIKLGKSNLPPHQKRSYRNIIQEGYGFRFFHVNIISFARNEFEIREKLLTNPSELKSFPLKNVKSLNVDNVL